MDAAYDAEPIRQHSRSLGHVPLIDTNPRRNKALARNCRSPAPEKSRLPACRAGSLQRAYIRVSASSARVSSANSRGRPCPAFVAAAKVMSPTACSACSLTVVQLVLPGRQHNHAHRRCTPPGVARSAVRRNQRAASPSLGRQPDTSKQPYFHLSACRRFSRAASSRRSRCQRAASPVES